MDMPIRTGSVVFQVRFWLCFPHLEFDGLVTSGLQLLSVHNGFGRLIVKHAWERPVIWPHEKLEILGWGGNSTRTFDEGDVLLFGRMYDDCLSYLRFRRAGGAQNGAAAEKIVEFRYWDHEYHQELDQFTHHGTTLLQFLSKCDFLLNSFYEE
jgi:hypothetical protein